MTTGTSYSTLYFHAKMSTFDTKQKIRRLSSYRWRSLLVPSCSEKHHKNTLLEGLFWLARGLRVHLLMVRSPWWQESEVAGHIICRREQGDRCMLQLNLPFLVSSASWKKKKLFIHIYSKSYGFCKPHLNIYMWLPK